MNNFRDATHMVDGEYGLRFYRELDGKLYVWHTKDIWDKYGYWTPSGYTSLEALKRGSAYPVIDIDLSDLDDD